MKKLVYSLVLFPFFFISCEKMNEEIDALVNDTEESNISPVAQTRISYEARSALYELDGIPVHISLPAGAVANNEKFLSCYGGTNYQNYLADRDDGSGRQRWYIKHKNLTMWGSTFYIESVGGIQVEDENI